MRGRRADREIKSENQKESTNPERERERGSREGRNVICKRPLSKLCPLPTPLQGIDLVCMPFPPLWILHSVRERERPATEQNYRQGSQSPLVLKWTMRKIIMIRCSWSIRAQSADNCRRLRGADFAQGWRKVPRCCGLPSSLPPLWELAIKRGNQRVSVQNTSSCQNLIENREKAQNHTFCNHSARNTFSARFWWRSVGLQCPLPVLFREKCLTPCCAVK